MTAPKSRVTFWTIKLEQARDLFGEFLFQSAQRFKEHVADNGEAARIHFVQSVLWSVPVGCYRVEINDVVSRTSTPEKREIVVAGYGIVFVNKNICITQP